MSDRVVFNDRIEPEREGGAEGADSPYPTRAGHYINRSSDDFIGDRLGVHHTIPVAQAPRGSLSPEAKEWMIRTIDGFLALWPYQYDRNTENGIVRTDHRMPRIGIAEDPRLRPAHHSHDDKAYYELDQFRRLDGNLINMYGGGPSWFTDLDDMCPATLEKIAQYWLDVKEAIRRA